MKQRFLNYRVFGKRNSDRFVRLAIKVADYFDSLATQRFTLIGTHRTSYFLLPVSRAIGQFDDPLFRNVLLRSLAWSLACFAILFGGTIWAVHRLLSFHGWLAWITNILGSIGASLFAFWLFLPVAALIGTLYFDCIARAVEQRFYAWLAPPQGASILDQIWDGLTVGLKVLALNVVALCLALILPGAGLVLGWFIATYAIGRGLFVAVAMRRMPRTLAEELYRSKRFIVLAQGAILALATYVPVINLLIPVVGVAAMVHVVDMTLTSAEIYRQKLV